MVNKSDRGNKDGIEPRQENVRPLNSKVYLYSDSSEFWNGVFGGKKKSTMRREKKKEKKQQYKTIGTLKPRKLDQIWNFYQKAVEQCEENSMIKQKLWEVQNRKEQKNKETGKDRKKANRESVEVLVCSSQWNTHNCAFNFNSKRYLN